MPRMLFFLLINVKMPTIVGILTFMSRKNFMLNSIEHEKSFITSGPGLQSFHKIKVTLRLRSEMSRSCFNEVLPVSF